MSLTKQWHQQQQKIAAKINVVYDNEAKQKDDTRLCSHVCDENQPHSVMASSKTEPVTTARRVCRVDCERLTYLVKADMNKAGVEICGWLMRIGNGWQNLRA